MFSGAWTFQSTAASTGTQTVSWSYRGFHSFFRVTLGLDAYVFDGTTTTTTNLVTAGPVNCCTTPSAGFAYSGTHTFTVQAGDIYGFKLSGSHSDGALAMRGPLTVDQNVPPSCGSATPSVSSLWPPNHKFVDINVLDVTDRDGDPLTITIDSIHQDELVDGSGDGSFAPDRIIDDDTASVRSERSGNENGRVYHIGFTATDSSGESCSSEVQVGVPHDKNGTPIDDGALYNSTV